MNLPLIEARDLSLSDPHRERLTGFNVQVHRGETVGLLGLNGAGKSTVLSLLAGALAPTSGKVLVNGEPLANRRELQKHIGLVPQTPPLEPAATVDEHLHWAGRLHGMDSTAVRHATERVRDQLELGALGRRLAGRLSGGMARRVALAMALIHQPDVLLLDEPGAGLDPVQGGQLLDLIRKASRHSAVIVASHLLHEIEQLCQRVILLHEGVCVFEDSLIDQPAECLLTFDEAPPDEALLQLPGVDAIRHREANTVIVRLTAADDSAHAELFAGRGWGLRSCTPHSSRLIERFHELSDGTAA